MEFSAKTYLHSLVKFSTSRTEHFLDLIVYLSLSHITPNRHFNHTLNKKCNNMACLITLSMCFWPIPLISQLALDDPRARGEKGWISVGGGEKKYYKQSHSRAHGSRLAWHQEAAIIGIRMLFSQKHQISHSHSILIIIIIITLIKSRIMYEMMMMSKNGSSRRRLGSSSSSCLMLGCVYEIRAPSVSPWRILLKIYI